jgi:hypothetical protein
MSWTFRAKLATVCNMLVTIIGNYRLCDRFAWFRLLLLGYGSTMRTASVITSEALYHVMSPNLHPSVPSTRLTSSLPYQWFHLNPCQNLLSYRGEETNTKRKQKELMFFNTFPPVNQLIHIYNRKVWEAKQACFFSVVYVKYWMNRSLSTSTVDSVYCDNHKQTNTPTRYTHN